MRRDSFSILCFLLFGLFRAGFTICCSIVTLFYSSGSLKNARRQAGGIQKLRQKTVLLVEGDHGPAGRGGDLDPNCQPLRQTIGTQAGRP